MNLYYLHFNNYYNRIVKKFDTLAEYLVWPYYDNVVTNSIAFNPNDGVITTQVANVPVGNAFTYDYAILADGNDIVSRWFILDANRNLNGQYRLSLKRDLFADSYAPVLDAPAFIEKATLNYNDPMIFNSENMTFNQIKKSETPLKDETGCPWIVGYIAREDSGGAVKSYSVSTSVSTPITQTVESLSDWIGYSSYSKNKPFLGPLQKYSFNIRYNTDDTRKFYSEQQFNDSYFITFGGKSNRSETDYGLQQSQKLPSDFNYIPYNSKILSAFKDFKEVHTLAEYNNFAAQNNTYIYVNDAQKTYKISITPTTITESERVSSSTSPRLFDEFKAPFSSNYNNNSFGYDYTANAYNVSLTEVDAETYSLTIPSNRYHLDKVPYDMFAIPYKDGLVIKKNDAINCQSTSKEIGLAIANAISLEFTGGGFLYDIQLLPYCPARFNIDDDGVINAMGDNATFGMFDIIDSKNNVVSECFLCNSDSFSFNIALENPIVIKDPKIESQCDMYRLCSPNYNGVFEFNAAKNGGISYFNVDCTYKPYNPYIHINPNFDILYGQDFNDSRGLIVGGDFSLPQTSSAWTTYELNNKNYQNSFDRQIQNMEVNNAIQNIQTVTQSALGVVGGALGGFMAGGIGGAIAGGTASAVGGAMDYALQKAGQAEAIDYTKDQFGYSLGNIKARATSIAKTTAFTYNNKLFPFLEYYTCTEEEKKALEDKIKYNGMTVMRIGSIREFLKSERTYIKGKLIRFEGFDEDFHYVNELANEFNKGVFI